jgi:hypothetical protein
MGKGPKQNYALGAIAAALAALLTLPNGANALASPLEGQLGLPVIAESNSVQTRQFHIDNARIPGHISTRQSVIAWQVTQGTWNGQALDGLCLVLVKSISDDGLATPRISCYVSNEATLAQREALLGAFIASQPQAIAREVTGGMLRLEPAVITLEIEGTTVVLHLGLIA